MMSSNSATSSPTNNCSVETSTGKESVGQAAETAGDLASEGNGKEILQSKSNANLRDEANKNSKSMDPTLDPICNIEVDPNTAVHVERDGKTFYFCGNRCRGAFLETIARVKSESNEGSCCDESLTL